MILAPIFSTPPASSWLVYDFSFGLAAASGDGAFQFVERWRRCVTHELPFPIGCFGHNNSLGNSLSIATHSRKRRRVYAAGYASGISISRSEMSIHPQ